MRKMDYDVLLMEPVPRVLPKDKDTSLVKRNRRMLGQLLGTLEKFQEEDKHLSTTEAYMRRSDSLRRAEEKAREESERLRQQEREQIVEKRRRDLTLRARVAAKAEQKKMELRFILWSEHIIRRRAILWCKFSRYFWNGRMQERQSYQNTRNRLRRTILQMPTKSLTGGKMPGTHGNRTIW